MAEIEWMTLAVAAAVYEVSVFSLRAALYRQSWMSPEELSAMRMTRRGNDGTREILYRKDVVEEAVAWVTQQTLARS
jgi:hypothetical protein